MMTRHDKSHGRFAGLSRRVILAGLLAGALVSCAPQAHDNAPLTVFAAASLTDVLEGLARDHESRTGQPVRLSFAASGAVARQVQAGAPADIVILADQPWMDRLEEAGAIRADSRIDLIGNRLVVIAPDEGEPEADVFAAMERADGRLVIGDPQSVPAGAYARTWLQTRGLWDRLQPRLVTAADVRAAQAFVARGEAQLGIVYRSDTVGESAVRVVLEPPAAEQPRIVYPAALTRDASAGAEDFLAFLQSSNAAAAFARAGFTPPPPA